MTDITQKISDLYRTDSARIIAVLTRVFGLHNYALVEDVLQEAFGKALINWKTHCIPDNPSSWILKTAKNAAIDTIRAQKTRTKFAPDITQLLESEWSLNNTIEHEFSEQNINDDELSMLFVCCHQDISPENRIPFILQTLCGFSINAISRALIIPESTVKKRLLRTKEKLKHCTLQLPERTQRLKALSSIHTVIYLLFNEGFYSSRRDKAVNLEFCMEAIRLVGLLVNNESLVIPESIALLALMNFNLSRNKARFKCINSPSLEDATLKTQISPENQPPVPINLQDRTLWDKQKIKKGNHLLTLIEQAKSIHKGRFFWEAKIAQIHSNASCFETTDWRTIVNYYDQLYSVTGSPLASVNRAIAVAYSGEPRSAVDALLKLEKTPTFKSSHIPSAALAHSYAMLGERNLALEYESKSKALGGTPIEQQNLREQLERLLNC